MKLKAITGIALTMLLLTVVSPIDVSVGVVDFDGESGEFVAQSGVDWWPMFRHDLSHTGYSTSTAPNTNNTIWSYPTGDRVISSPAVAQGKVYVGSYDRKVYCLNATTGAHIWNYTTGAYFSSPAVAQGKVYVGSTDMKVWCLNASSASMISYEREIWNYTTGWLNDVRSSPAVADDKVYVGSFDRKVYCLNATTGAHIWGYTTGDYVSSSPAVADGKVYVGSYDRKVYAFGPDTTPPNIPDVSQFPFKNNVTPEDDVHVNATVTDDLSGVKQVTLNYTHGNGTWINVDMTNLEGNVWNATIPKFPYCTHVTYAIIAEDNANNTITTEERGYEYKYHVIPEFPSSLTLPLFMIVTLLVALLWRRRHSRTRLASMTRMV